MSWDLIPVVKSKIQDKLGIPSELQRLIFAGTLLENWCTCSHYKVKDRSTVHLVFRMPYTNSDDSPSGFIRFEIDKVSKLGEEGQESPMVDDFKTTFNNKTLNWGFYEYISWEEVVNEKKGFSEGDKLTFEARFTLSNIVGIRLAPRFDFTDSNEPSHDVAFVIGGEKVYVSKQILAVHSPVFKAMFYGDFVKKDRKEIELNDIVHKEFVEVLNLIYPTGEKPTDTNVESVLKLADRFQIEMLIGQAEQFLIDSAKFDTPSKLEISDKYRLVTLQDHCLNKLKSVKDIQNLKATDGYKSLSDTAKAMLLEKVMKLG